MEGFFISNIEDKGRAVVRRRRTRTEHFPGSPHAGGDGMGKSVSIASENARSA
jgi:hypothetical protein